MRDRTARAWGLAAALAIVVLVADQVVKDIVEKHIVRLLAEDVIEESDSPWASNVVLVKRGDKIRFCVDYRKVNAITKADQYPIPRIEDYLNALGGKKFFSAFDANA